MELRATRGVALPSHTSPSMESHWKDLERRQGTVIFIWNIPGKGGYHPLTLCILTSQGMIANESERFLMISLSKLFPLKSIIFFSGKRSAAQVWLPEATCRYVTVRPSSLVTRSLVSLWCWCWCDFHWGCLHLCQKETSRANVWNFSIASCLGIGWNQRFSHAWSLGQYQPYSAATSTTHASPYHQHLMFIPHFSMRISRFPDETK